jgi:hypothetical protein
MFHYTVRNGVRAGEWALICYACLPRLRSAGYDVQQHDGKKDDKCALCGMSTVPPTYGERGPSARGTQSIPVEDPIVA